MALVPRAVRPKTIVRRQAMRRGVKGGSDGWRAVAYYFVGGLAMVRTQAILRGALGGSNKWRVIGAIALLAQYGRSAFVRQSEPLAKERVKAGEFVKVSVTKPLSRKEQKRTGITRRFLEEQALADVAAAEGASRAS